MQADRLLGPELADVDGNVEDRRGTISAFNGEPPSIQLFETKQEECEAIGIVVGGMPRSRCERQ